MLICMCAVLVRAALGLGSVIPEQSSVSDNVLICMCAVLVRAARGGMQCLAVALTGPVIPEQSSVGDNVLICMCAVLVRAALGLVNAMPSCGADWPSDTRAELGGR